MIVTLGEAGIQAAQRATKTIPTVGMVADMVRTGLAASMAKPGGNLTGVNILAGELDVKRLAILHEAVPTAKRIGALALPDRGLDTLPELETAARRLDLELVVISVRRLGELARGFDALQSARSVGVGQAWTNLTHIVHLVIPTREQRRARRRANGLSYGIR